MSIRPQPARWFEVLVMREDLAAAMDVLARSARVELQAHGETRRPVPMPEIRDSLEEYDGLEKSYGPYWPLALARRCDLHREPAVMLEDAMTTVRRWTADAQDPVEKLEALNRSSEDHRLLKMLFRDAAGSLPDLDKLARSGPLLQTCLYRLASDDWPPSLPASVIAQRLDTGGNVFLLAVGLPEDIRELSQQLQLQKARPVFLPADLPASATQAAAVMDERLQQGTEEIDRLRSAIDALNTRHDIVDAIADIRFVRWYIENVPVLSTTENFAWISGWTSDDDEQSLLRRLADENIKGLLRVCESPHGFEPPQILRNPRWMRPFEQFTGMLGVPASGEVDPTRIVAIVAPLMFGYMFGDVGHGAVLLLAGLIFYHQLPALRLLIAGGLASIGFGFLFGSVFAMEGLIRPLWIHPLEHPLAVLFVPMVGGAALLLVGMCLDAVQAYWQRKGRFWWRTGAGLTLCYVSLAGAFFQPRLLLVSLLGAAWFVVGHGLAVRRDRLAAAGAAVVEFLETLMQLVVNTVSFVRVGAFALAHAGLSMAIVGVAETPASLMGKVVLLILGNLLIIALEGLVVGIQTTRLVLFEFFVRFMRAEGRRFKPMTPALLQTPKEKRRSS